MIENTTIAAIATTIGEAAIAIIRLSGENALPIIQSVFTAQIIDRKPVVGWIIDTNTKFKIDQVVVTAYLAPKSYTGEDLIEISCHGGVALQRRILALLIDHGAAPAQGGEFSKRAFLNGKLDLLQAEAIINLIRAKSSKAIEYAAKQLDGQISDQLHTIEQELIHILSTIEASIDFPDDIESPSYQQIVHDLANMLINLLKLQGTAKAGRAAIDGVRIVIVGEPNVGKSTIFNALLMKERAIVSDIPGTTTDQIEDFVVMEGLPVYLSDTAGIREPQGIVERMGIERTIVATSKADIVVHIYDQGSRNMNDFGYSITEGAHRIAVFNKSDLPGEYNTDLIALHKDAIILSATSTSGLVELQNRLHDIIRSQFSSDSGIVMSTERQIMQVSMLVEGMRETLSMLKSNIELDLITINLRDAIGYVSGLTGHDIINGVVDKVFHEFCIGK